MITSAVNSEVVAEPRSRKNCQGKDVKKVFERRYIPPISAVRTFPALITSKVAEAMLLAIESSLRIV